ncbi:response regulator transcription factor [Spirosoma flavus]
MELTEREKSILNLIARGYTTTEIAKLIHLSTRTVGGHEANLFKKFQVSNRADLTRCAKRIFP